MPRVLRFRGFVLATLAAFVLVQPAAWCSALCLLEGHHHRTVQAGSADHGSAVLPGGDCHPADGGAVHNAPLPQLSTMAPAGPQIAIAPPSGSVEAARTLVTSPRTFSPAAEPPPPRSA